MLKGRLCPLKEPSCPLRASPAQVAVSSGSLPTLLSALKRQRAAVTQLEQASLGLEAAKQSHNGRFGFLGTRHPRFRVPVARSQEQKAPKRRAGGAPGWPWAAPGEGPAASSAPAARHLVNTIHNVTSAPCTSFSRAGEEFAKLQLDTEPKNPLREHERLGSTPKTQRGGRWHPSSAPICAPAAKGLQTRDKHPSRAHGDWGGDSGGSSPIDSQRQLQRGAGKIYDGHRASISK